MDDLWGQMGAPFHSSQSALMDVLLGPTARHCHWMVQAVQSVRTACPSQWVQMDDLLGQMGALYHSSQSALMESPLGLMVDHFQ
jgi:hypothetical protein